MSPIVKVVTAYVPLQVKHLNAEAYHDYGTRLEQACGGNLCWFDRFPFAECWLAKERPEALALPPATEPAADRFDTPEQFVRSNVVQHSRLQWARAAVQQHEDTDVIIWLDLAILKQGAWRNNQITEDHVAAFIERVRDWFVRTGGLSIPFPGIDPNKGQIAPFGNNWRFCGSTHIWPTRFLPALEYYYKRSTLAFIDEHRRVPLDLAVWPHVELLSGLPFEWYQAEYDASQLTNFP